MEGFFLGRQPILDRNQNLVAFELLFRSDKIASTANITNDLTATAHVIVNAYSQLGTENILYRQRNFINVDAELLMSDAICLLPNKHVVLEVLETIKITEVIVRRCSELKQMGYQLALDDVTEINDEIEQLLPVISVVKVDVLALEKNTLSSLVNKLRRWPVRLLAEKVETREQASYCMELGFELFQGYYFAKPDTMTGKRIDPAKLTLLKLMTLVKDDNDISEIEREIKQQPTLIYNLLYMVNSVACSVPKKINSIRHAIMVLGCRQLHRWFQLLLYTTGQSSGSMSNALLQTAAARGKMMELIFIMGFPYDKNYQESAFMVGVFSLLDVLLSLEMQQIVDKLDIPQEMYLALMTREGRLGQALKLVEAKEEGNFVVIQEILTELGFLNLSDLTEIELEALGWAIRIDEVAN